MVLVAHDALRSPSFVCPLGFACVCATPDSFLIVCPTSGLRPLVARPVKTEMPLQHHFLLEIQYRPCREHFPLSSQ